MRCSSGVPSSVGLSNTLFPVPDTLVLGDEILPSPNLPSRPFLPSRDVPVVLRPSPNRVVTRRRPVSSGVKRKPLSDL